MPKRRSTSVLPIPPAKKTNIAHDEDIEGSIEGINNALDAQTLTVELTSERQMDAIQQLSSNPGCSLNQLELIGKYQLRPLFTVQNNSLTCLALYKFTVSNQLLNNLFNFATALKSLTLVHCNIISALSNIHSIVNLTTNRLSSLTLFHSTISQSVLDQIFMNLHGQSSLNQLDIKQQHAVNTAELEGHISDSQLTHLKLSPVEQVQPLLQALTRKTRLSSLHLSGNFFDLILKPGSYPLKQIARCQLTELTLSTCSSEVAQIIDDLMTVKRSLSMKLPSEYNEIDKRNARIIAKISKEEALRNQAMAPGFSRRLF